MGPGSRSSRSHSRRRSRSLSTSRSRSGSREKVDKFGRVIPRSKKRSRSRSRSRERERRRPRSRSRSYERDRHKLDHNNSRGRPRAYPRESQRERDSTSNRTDIEDPRFLNARIFIGNMPIDKISKAEVEEMFKPYGKILGCSLHERGYGFVQFDKEEEARKAVEMEKGSLLKGSVLDVKMAAEGRRGGPAVRTATARVGRSASPPYARDRGYPPPLVGTSARAPPPPVAGARERSPLRDPYAAERYRDPYRDPLPPPRESRDLAPLPLTSKDLLPPRRDDPYYDDPYRRPPPEDPYFDRYRDDPYSRYRRDPYDPYARDPYYGRDYPPPFEAPPPPPRKPLPPDCQIIIMNSALRTFAESIEAKLRANQLITEIVVIPEDRTIPQMIEEASLKKCLFCIILNSQNETHRSMTLNILHGTPQEHRNMPVDDAAALIFRSFDQYLQTVKEKAASSTATPSAAPASSTRVAPFVPPGPDISYLLNLLADNRQLTVEEIDKLLVYLKERKNKMLAAEGRRPEVEMEAPAVGLGGASTVGEGDTNANPSSAYLQQQQQELQAKILGILNGSSSGTPAASAVPAAGLGGISSQAGHAVTGMASAHQQAAGRVPQSPPSLINFDNPNVQKALDNLIQSGPNLLKNISTANPVIKTSPTTGNPMMSRAGAQSGGYGAQQGQGQQHAQQQYYGGAQQQGGYGAPQQGAQLRPGANYQGMQARMPQQAIRPRMM